GAGLAAAVLRGAARLWRRQAAAAEIRRAGAAGLSGESGFLHLVPAPRPAVPVRRDHRGARLAALPGMAVHARHRPRRRHHAGVRNRDRRGARTIHRLGPDPVATPDPGAAHLAPARGTGITGAGTGGRAAVPVERKLTQSGRVAQNAKPVIRHATAALISAVSTGRR